MYQLKLKAPAVSIQDTPDNFTATSVEGALQELATTKANKTHTHSISDITGLQTKLDQLTTGTGLPISISDVTNLQASLDAKASVSHTHDATSITILDTGNNFVATDLESVLAELFRNVSDGKNIIATAISDKGVNASGSDTFSDLGDKIGQIVSGGSTLVADILDGDIFRVYPETSVDDINTIIDTLGRIGGGTVYFAQGDYLLNNPIIVRKSNISLIGEGIVELLCNDDWSYAINKNYPYNILDVADRNYRKGVGAGIIDIRGKNSTDLIENIIIKNMIIDGQSNLMKNSSGILAKYTGYAPTTGLTTGTYSRYDSSTIGRNIANKNGVTIENCTIQNNEGYGVYLYFSFNCSIALCITENNSSTGIYLGSSSNNSISGNVVQNNGVDGIYLSSSSNNSITGNTTQNNNGYGICLNYSSLNNNIMSNTIQNNGRYGIYLDSSNSNSIVGNTIQNNSSYGIYLTSSSNNVITGNTVQNNGSNGIYVYSSSNNNTITGNAVQNNNSYGIYLSSSSNNSITGNTTQNNNGYGIILEALSNNNIVAGNTTYLNTSGNYSDNGTGNKKINNIES